MLYRLCSHPFASTESEYPSLYDHSLLLEQSLGLNSGWQDARGASGGPSAIKDFYAPPTAGLPTPERTFLTDVNEDQFTARIREQDQSPKKRMSKADRFAEEEIVKLKYDHWENKRKEKLRTVRAERLMIVNFLNEFESQERETAEPVEILQRTFLD